MTQDVKTSKIHWPSLFWFFVAAISALDLINEISITAAFLTAGFICMGYSSIGLIPANLFTQIPANLFTQKVSLLKTSVKQTKVQRTDVIIQGAGFTCLVIGLVAKWCT